MNRQQQKPRPGQQGFSLLELLVVIVIIGILIAIATISFAPRDQSLQKSAERLDAMIKLAADEALMQGQEMGLYFYPDGYEFSVFSPEDGRWVLMDDDEMFFPRQLDERLELELYIEDQLIVLETTAVENEEDYEPQVYMFSSGEITPFQVRFRPAFDTYGVVLTIEADGKSSIQADDS